MNAVMIAQSSSGTELAEGAHLAGAGLVLIGIVIVALLGGAMWREAKRREQEVPPRPEEQPTSPDHREHIEEVRDEDEDDFPHEGRLLPYNLKTHSSHTTGKGPDERPKHGKNAGGGAFGSGGLGG
ncbi:DUF6479 family protein [Streptomyces sp. NPDC002659]|uniref:DUF6479 family protein n=1 Tax=Streptomyces sp. NPDC002659 TaxID=3364656 RepID=UPI0036A6EA67